MELEKQDKEGILDRLSGKLWSRKLSVFVIGSVFLYLGKIVSDEWVTLAVAYVGVQGFLDLALQWRNSGK